MASPEHHEVIVVGGGVGGLFTARKLIAAGIQDVVVLESRPSVGGRIVTTRGDADQGNKPMFNNFAWRISEANPMMLALCKELGLDLTAQTTPKSRNQEEKHGACKHGPYSADCTHSKKVQVAEGRAPLSDFANSSLTVSAAEADFQDRNSGYAGRTSQIAFPDESHGSQCWFVEGGMDMIPKTLASQLPEGCVRTNTRASQVEKRQGGEQGYRISAVKREKGEKYTPLKFTCSQIILAAPPFSLRGFEVAKDMGPALFSVYERRGGHVYVKCKPNTPNVPDHSNSSDRVYRNVPDSILQQVISGDYGGGVFQAAYATDRFERVWREVQYQGPDAVMRQVKEHLNKIGDLLPNVEWDEAIEEVYVRLLFVHRWQNEAHVTGKNKLDLSLQAITPNPYRLPGLYLVGEAFSPFQGWTEGAVWTADKAADIIAKARKSNGVYEYGNNDGIMSKFSAKKNIETDDKGKIPGDVMVYRGLVVDVSDWVERHPGGRGMIAYHKGEDLSELFDNFHPGWPNPLATIFGLQIGTTD